MPLFEGNIIDGNDVGVTDGANRPRLLFNRLRRSWSCSTVRLSTFTATSRPSRVSRARYTSPMPPSAINSTISYGPRLAPLAWIMATDSADEAAGSANALKDLEYAGLTSKLEEIG